MRIGDIFTWSWNEESEKNMARSFQAGTAYWCMDRYCVAVESRDNNLILVDTYNYNQYASDSLFDYDSLSSEFMKVVDPAKADLEYLGNVNDYERIDKHDIKDYKYSDILIIPCHAGCRPVCLKLKEAQKDKEVMIEELENEISQQYGQIKMAEWRIENYKKQVEELK